MDFPTAIMITERNIKLYIGPTNENYLQTKKPKNSGQELKSCETYHIVEKRL